MNDITRQIVAAAPSLRRLGLRVLEYDLGDRGEFAYSIGGLELRHIGNVDLEADLHRLVDLAQALSICIQTEIDVAADQGGADRGLTMLTDKEAEAMRSWLGSVGFASLGPTALGLGERLGVDCRPSPGLRPQ